MADMIAPHDATPATVDAQALHEALLTIDTHVDIPWPPSALVTEDGPRRVDLPKMRRGNLRAVCFAAYVPQGPRTPEGHKAAGERALSMLDAIAGIADAPATCVALTADAIEAVRGTGTLAVIPCVENGYAMGEDLGLLAQFQAKGARYMTLTHNGHNALCDSSNPRRDLNDEQTLHNGLSPLGHEAIAEMNRLGMLVDVSHVSLQAALQAAMASKTPVLATHSCVKALCDVPRNADDRLLDALRDSGGMVNITAVPSFLRAGGKADKVTVSDFVDHLDYVVKRIGLAHAGISSDFDGGGGFSGWRDAGESGNVTAELVRRGYGAAEIAQLWGGNFLRLLRRAEAVANA